LAGIGGGIAAALKEDQMTTEKKVTAYDVKRQDLMTALAKCIELAPAKEQAGLANTLEAYVQRYGRTYDRLHKISPFLSDMLCTIEDACDARCGEARETENSLNALKSFGRIK
jgi:hypothetical protein